MDGWVAPAMHELGFERTQEAYSLVEPEHDVQLGFVPNFDVPRLDHMVIPHEATEGPLVGFRVSVISHRTWQAARQSRPDLPERPWPCFVWLGSDGQIGWFETESTLTPPRFETLEIDRRVANGVLKISYAPPPWWLDEDEPVSVVAAAIIKAIEDYALPAIRTEIRLPERSAAHPVTGWRDSRRPTASSSWHQQLVSGPKPVFGAPVDDLLLEVSARLHPDHFDWRQWRYVVGDTWSEHLGTPLGERRAVALVEPLTQLRDVLRLLQAG